MKCRKGSSSNGKSKSTSMLRRQQTMRNDGGSSSKVRGAALVGAALAAAADDGDKSPGRMQDNSSMIFKGNKNENEEGNEEEDNEEDDDDGDDDFDEDAYILEEAIEGEGSSGRTATASRGMEGLSLDELEKRQNAGFEDLFSDDILMRILRCLLNPTHIWDAVRVCRRWYVLQTCIELKKRAVLRGCRVPCLYPSRGRRGGQPPARQCSRQKVLKLDTADTECALATKLRNSCKRHTHALMIKNCTHLSGRGYQLISDYVANLKYIHLESCNSIDDASLGAILTSGAGGLQGVHLASVPNLTLRNVPIKAPQLRQLHVLGCKLVTGTTILSMLKGCPNLDSLCLSGMGVSRDWEDKGFRDGPALKLRRLELMNSQAITDTLLKLLGARLPLLRRLVLSNCSLVSDEGLKPLISACGPNLQKVVLTRCPGISDGVVEALWGAPASKLLDLSLAGTSLTDDGLRTLMQVKEASPGREYDFNAYGQRIRKPLGKLRNLSVACCPGITDAGLLHVVTHQSLYLLALKSFDIQGCPGLSALGLKRLRIAAKGKEDWKLVCDTIDV